MARELESWAAAFCDDGARHHAQQKEVMKLELDVECNPLSAQFSGRLYALMEQEEQAAQRGQTDAHARLSETVNVMMNQETKAHFDRQAEYSNKRWRALFEQRLAKELDAADKAVVAQHAALIKALLGSGGGAAAAAALPSSVDAAKAQLSAAHRGLGGAAEAPTASPSSVAAFGGDAPSGSAAVGLGTRDGGPAPRDSAACWRGRLRLQATAAWGDNEKYHLQVAFGNQISRVEDEWGAYEVQLNNDYEAQRADIEGRHQPDRGMQAPSPSSGKQWKDKAKQESLIHTAPVHSPTAAIPASPKRSGGGAGAGGGAGSSVAAQRELRQLDSSYRQAQQQFRTQKAAALRWIQRQADRMYTQAAAHAATTTFVGACVAAHTERRLLVLLRAECCVAAVRAALAGALQAAAAAAPAAASASSAPVGVGAALEVLRNLRQRAGDAEGLRARGGGGGGAGRMLQQRAGAGGGGGGGGGASSQQMKKAGGARAQTAAGRTRPRKQQW
jgi:hypothetical protein